MNKCKECLKLVKEDNRKEFEKILWDAYYKVVDVALEGEDNAPVLRSVLSCGMGVWMQKIMEKYDDDIKFEQLLLKKE